MPTFLIPEQSVEKFLSYLPDAQFLGSSHLERGRFLVFNSHIDQELEIILRLSIEHIEIHPVL